MISEAQKLQDAIIDKFELEILFDGLYEKIIKESSRIVIGVAGGPGVGKSVFAQHLWEFLTKRGKRLRIVETDDFLYSKKYLTRHNTPKRYPEGIQGRRLHEVIRDLKKGKMVRKPIYDKNLKDRSRQEEIISGGAFDVIIIDGVSAISNDRQVGNLLSLVDLRIYIHADYNDMKRWRIERDIEQYKKDPSKGRNPQQALEKWEKDEKIGLLRCALPSKKYADVIVVKRENHSIGGIKLMGNLGKHGQKQPIRRKVE